MSDYQYTGILPFFQGGQSNSDRLWSKIVAFLSRDIRSFFPSRAEALGSAVASQGRAAADLNASPAPDSPVEALVDFDKLPYLAYRREVLDWRDTFHANVTVTATKSLDTFVRHMDEELAEVSLFRSVFTRPADEVLASNFRRDIRMPLINALKQQEARLNASAQKLANFASVDLAIDTSSFKPGCASLCGIGFKPANRNLIKSRMQDLLLGPAGIAEDIRDQGSHISRKLLETKQS